MLVGRMVHDEVDDHPHPAVVGGTEHLHHVAEGSVSRIDPVVVLDVVAVVALRRRVERREPQTRDPELGEMVEPLREAAQVADSIVVGVEVGLDVEVLEDRGLPPQIAGVGESHRATS
ncbi:hypothetical protein GCM10009758_10770 [Microbacterium hatanonis]